jgi:hypothetical protein
MAIVMPPKERQGESPMIGTNRDLTAMREALEYELFRLQALKNLPGRTADPAFVDRQLVSLNRQRVALCAAIVNRRIEASKDVVVFSRWATGNGALNNIPVRRPARSVGPLAAYARQRP